MIGFLPVKWSKFTLKALYCNYSLLYISRQVYREYSDVIAKYGEFKFVFYFINSKLRPLKGLMILKTIYKYCINIKQLFNS